MSVISSPPVRYPGGKWRIASWIIAQFPPHLTYCEPFCGGASVFFRKQPSYYEVLNDLDSRIVNFFRVLREQPDALLYALQNTPFSREEYYVAFEHSDDALEEARRFIILTRQGFGGYARRTGWRIQKNLNRGKRLIDEWSDLSWVMDAAGRLKNAHIEHDDFEVVVERFDGEDTLFYVDPPYLSRTRKRFDHYTHDWSGESEHVRLAEKLHQIQGMVVLSGYAHALYDELYGDWRRLRKSTQTNGNGQATECLWLSSKAVELGRLPLFKGTSQ